MEVSASKRDVLVSKWLSLVVLCGWGAFFAVRGISDSSLGSILFGIGLGVVGFCFFHEPRLIVTKPLLPQIKPPFPSFSPAVTPFIFVGLAMVVIGCFMGL
jgi:hypothetical protein